MCTCFFTDDDFVDGFRGKYFSTIVGMFALVGTEVEDSEICLLGASEGGIAVGCPTGVDVGRPLGLGVG